MEWKTPRNVLQSPGERVGTVGDYELLLLSVEHWTATVVVRLGLIESELTRNASDVFTRELRERGGRPPDFPQSPAHEALASVRIAVTDDAGTEYEFASGSGPSWNGKSGVEWARDAAFWPGPPDDATVLRVSASAADDVLGEVSLPLR